MSALKLLQTKNIYNSNNSLELISRIILSNQRFLLLKIHHSSLLGSFETILTEFKTCL